MDDKKEIYRPEYSPAPAKPEGFDERLAQIGGRTLDGRPRLRVVWGCDARGFPSPDREEVKYPSPNDPLVGWACWILEELVGPEFFGDPGAWEKGRWAYDDTGKRVEVCAPYPSRGEYVFIQQLATPKGVPFPLGDQALTFIQFLVREAHLRPHNSHTEQAQIADRLKQLREWKDERRAQVSREALAQVYDDKLSRQEQIAAAQSREWSKMPSRGDTLLRRLREIAGTEKGATR